MAAEKQPQLDKVMNEAKEIDKDVDQRVILSLMKNGQFDIRSTTANFMFMQWLLNTVQFQLHIMEHEQNQKVALEEEATNEA